VRRARGDTGRGGRPSRVDGRAEVSLPLEGIRVLDLSRLLPGGFCSLLLADFGAEVLKVEDTGMGDYIRWSPPYHDGAQDSAKSALFLALNRNKRSIRLNLKHERGREALLRLVADHDVVLESFRPGVLDRLGVGYERMREVNPGIVYCAISGYGQTGPKREASGHDMNYLGLIGLLGLTGERGLDGMPAHPIQSAGQIADLGGGALMAAFGILAALREREGGPAGRAGHESPGSGETGRTGSGLGQMVDVSMADGALSWLAMVAGAYFADGAVPRRGGLPLAGSLICYRPYECADGWVTLGALEPKFWQAWCRGVDREDLIERQFEAPGSEAHGQVVEIFKARSRAGWERFASEHDCCLEPVLELDEALDSELVRAREMVVTLDQPGVPGGVRQLGIPVKLARTPGEHSRLPGPALGEHTEQVLAQAGYSQSEIAELIESGAAAGWAGPPTSPAGEGATFRA
jgi:alpha-methylacyl-CoA racemase